MSKRVQVATMPPCDLCGDGTEARFDARIPGSSWANLCKRHFDAAGCRLGTGLGQELTTAPLDEEDVDPRIHRLAEELGMEDDEIERELEDQGLTIDDLS